MEAHPLRAPDREPKVADLEVAMLVAVDVVRLDVQVQHRLRVEEGEAGGDLPRHLPHGILRQHLLLLVDLAPAHPIHGRQIGSDFPLFCTSYRTAVSY
jgi:hypothetical protein